ncbi:hypothetical protein [Rhodovulum adriaticum]|uniref:Uncharacterized protein n=1 Tax=Rhodovulum adriaticum TaxID=35804 RepID=A0A4R2NF90_RHOAD|nr:hypothetical protein [Rhodovulum adriaticum]MBK1637244.1 hypothetical protein [Rhodovulum adriaticum]TCP19999.1 hypothetical protein EV656_12311 [Rhodovulum adriaticum]
MAKDFADLPRIEQAVVSSANASTAEQERVSSFVKAWENQTARRAVKGGVGLTMALSLAACGGSSGDAPIRTYTVQELIETDDLVEEYNIAIEDADGLGPVTVAEFENVRAEVDAALNVEEFDEALDAGSITVAVSVADTAENILAATAEVGEELSSVITSITVTDAELTVDVADAEALIDLGAEMAEGSTVTVADTAEALLASEADFGEAAISVTDEALTTDVAGYEALLDLGASFEGAVTVADTAEALLASEADFGDAAVTVTNDALTTDVAGYEALLDLGASFEGAVTVADAAEALLASEADFGDAAVTVTDDALTTDVAGYEALLGLGASFEGDVTVADTAEALLASEADFGDAAVTVTDPSPVLDVADFLALDALGASFAGAVTLGVDGGSNGVTLAADDGAFSYDITNGNYSFTVDGFGEDDTLLFADGNNDATVSNTPFVNDGEFAVASNDGAANEVEVLITNYDGNDSGIFGNAELVSEGIIA